MFFGIIFYIFVEIGNKDAGSGTVVIGEVVNFHVNKDIYFDGKIKASELKRTLINHYGAH